MGRSPWPRQSVFVGYAWIATEQYPGIRSQLWNTNMNYKVNISGEGYEWGGLEYTYMRIHETTIIQSSVFSAVVFSWYVEMTLAAPRPRIAMVFRVLHQFILTAGLRGSSRSANVLLVLLSVPIVKYRIQSNNRVSTEKVYFEDQYQRGQIPE